MVGSRARPWSVTESTTPIDAIPYQDVVSQGNTDVADRLRAVVPSCNVNPQPVGDAARLIRPANLRGLAPDHTLVLVNGKRRHRGAVITWIGNGVSDGAARGNRFSAFTRSASTACSTTSASAWTSRRAAERPPTLGRIRIRAPAFLLDAGGRFHGNRPWRGTIRASDSPHA